MVGGLNVWKWAAGCDQRWRDAGGCPPPPSRLSIRLWSLRAKRWGANGGSPPNPCPPTRMLIARTGGALHEEIPPPLQTPPAPGHVPPMIWSARIRELATGNERSTAKRASAVYSKPLPAPAQGRLPLHPATTTFTSVSVESGCLNVWMLEHGNPIQGVALPARSRQRRGANGGSPPFSGGKWSRRTRRWGGWCEGTTPVNGRGVIGRKMTESARADTTGTLEVVSGPPRPSAARSRRPS